MEYNEPLITCDIILKLFGDNVALDRGNIYLHVDKPKNIVTNALTKLEKDGYLIQYGSAYYKLGADALTFISNGGYEGQVEREKFEKEEELIRRNSDREIVELNRTKLKLDIKNATRIYKTYWITFAMAIIGLVISIILLLLRFYG